MALDFPTSPVNGQIYDNYYYDSTMGTWRAQGSGLALNAFVNPTITGGTISNLTTDLAVADGGTGASDAAGARTNLGITPANIGAATISHTHAAGDITSGNLNIAQGGTGSTLGAGLVPVIPGSVAVSAGSGSVDASGIITFSAAPIVVARNVFSSQYKNYLVVVNITSGSADAGFHVQTSIDTTRQTSSYTYTYTESNSGVAFNTTGGSSQIYVRVGRITQANGGSGSFFVYNPTQTAQTRIIGAVHDGFYYGHGGGSWTSTSAVNGIAILTGGASTMTGTFQIYALKEG